MTDEEHAATGAEMSHGLLVALLAALGGSHDLRSDQLEAAAMGNQRGEFYGVELVPLDSGEIRLQLVPQSERTSGEGR